MIRFPVCTCNYLTHWVIRFNRFSEHDVLSNCFLGELYSCVTSYVKRITNVSFLYAHGITKLTELSHLIGLVDLTYSLICFVRRTLYLCSNIPQYLKKHFLKGGSSTGICDNYLILIKSKKINQVPLDNKLLASLQKISFKTVITPVY